MTEKKVGLKAFAQARQTKPTKCWVCSLPERKEIDDELQEGQINGADIADWLITERGYNAGAELLSQRIRRHRKNGHVDVAS